MTRLLPRRSQALTPGASETPQARAWRETHFHPCCAPSCSTWIAKGFVCCGPHWQCIPQEWRDVLAEAFRCREQAPDLYEAACTKARKLLGAA